MFSTVVASCAASLNDSFDASYKALKELYEMRLPIGLTSTFAILLKDEIVLSCAAGMRKVSIGRDWVSNDIIGRDRKARDARIAALNCADAVAQDIERIRHLYRVTQQLNADRSCMCKAEDDFEKARADLNVLVSKCASAKDAMDAGEAKFEAMAEMLSNGDMSVLHSTYSSFEVSAEVEACIVQRYENRHLCREWCDACIAQDQAHCAVIKSIHEANMARASMENAERVAIAETRHMLRFKRE